MAIERSYLGGIGDAIKALGNAAFAFSQKFGGNNNATFKPFSTNYSASGYPHYQAPINTNAGLVGSGAVYVGADSSGLNPYGRNTLAEGIISGPTPTSGSFDLNITPGDVRTFGIKTPSQFVGWGYDQFGFPAPNFNRAWSASGNFSGNEPSTRFLGTGLNAVTGGRDVPYGFWNAGPMDLRWDMIRKVWTPPQSVYAAVVLAAYQTGALVTDYNEPLAASEIYYDAMMYDGPARQIRVTGIAHIGPKPFDDKYLVYPQRSGSFAFIVHAPVSGVPTYGLWLSEVPGADECAATATTASRNGSTSSDSLLGALSYSNLIGNPLGSQYGGTDYDDHPSGTILMGSLAGSGDFQQVRLVAGTGISFVSSPTGTTFTIQFASGVNFTSGGVNTTITELQGLLVPLTIGQGGTGSSTKNFIDLTTTQVASGVKTFNSQIKVASGSVSVPGLGFNNDGTTGLYSSLNKLNLTSSGTKVAEFHYKSSAINSDLHIAGLNENPLAYGDNSYAPLMVTQYFDGNYNNHIMVLKDRGSTVLGHFDQYGRWVGRFMQVSGHTATSGGPLFDIIAPNGYSDFTISARNNNSGVYFSVSNEGSKLTLGPSGHQTSLLSSSGNRQIELASGYLGDIAVAKVGGGTRTLHVAYGLITGYTDS